jgi:hypothetical protein
MMIVIAGRHHGLPSVETLVDGLSIVKSADAVSDERLAVKAFASMK